MTDNDKMISALINVLCVKNAISTLEKDILDTWNILHKVPFDADSAHKQIFSNNISHWDIFTTINALPGVVNKFGEIPTQDDMMFSLRLQLDGLVAKEMEILAKGINRA